jgi:hypothetical protein
MQISHHRQQQQQQHFLGLDSTYEQNHEIFGFLS